MLMHHLPASALYLLVASRKPVFVGRMAAFAPSLGALPLQFGLIALESYLQKQFSVALQFDCSQRFLRNLSPYP